MTTVGSVKASAGHAESAAGTAGLVRLALALRSGQAPPNAQLRSLNPHVGAAVGVSGGCALPTQLSASPGGVGGVSSFGYSGTIAHAVARAAPPVVAAPSLDAGRAPIRLRRRAYPWRAPDAPPSPLDALAMAHLASAVKRCSGDAPDLSRRWRCSSGKISPVLEQRDEL